MKPGSLKSILWLQALVIIGLAAALAYFARDELPRAVPADSTDASIKLRNADTANGGVSISATARAAGGIDVSPAPAYVLRPHTEAFGTVVVLQPLLQLRGQLLAAAAEQQAARVALDRADSELERMRTLYADDRNVSQRAVQAAESDQAAAKGRFVATATNLENLHLQLHQGWGETVARWISSDPPAGQFARLLANQAVLLQIFTTGAPAAKIEITPAGGGSGTHTYSANYVSPAPQTDGGVVGAVHYYLCDNAALAAGTRLLARLPLSGEARQGVRVPAGALIWHAGKSWVYVQRDDVRFTRHDASGAEAIGNDWFIADLAAGTRVVIAGAQLLLSEEMRFQIKNENED